MDERKEINYDISDCLKDLVYIARDCNLPKEIEDKYQPGLILREKGFCDGTYIIGGMTTTHRYTILSNQFFDLSSFAENKEGLCTTNRDARFKVLDKFSVNGKTQITLLELPRDEKWKNFKNVTYIIERKIAIDARNRFMVLSKADPLPKQNTPQMLARFHSPIGMLENGTLSPIE